MKKLLVLSMMWAACLSAVSAAVIVNVERTNGYGPDNRAPIGAYEPDTPPLPWPEGGLQTGVSRALTPYVYSDRTFWWNNVPDEMVGWEHVRTFNNDKEPEAADVKYTVTTSKAAAIWIAFESRLATSTDYWRPLEEPITPWGQNAPESPQVLVDWLTRHVGPPGTFTDTGMTVNVQEGDPGTTRTFLVYSAQLPAGSYEFTWQANRNISNYIIGSAPPPSKAWGPNPYDGEELVEIERVLSWEAPEDPNLTIYGYDLYLDPNETKVTAGDPTVLKAEGLTETSYPADLLYDTQFFWRVDVAGLYDDDPNQMTVVNQGPVWRFSTAPEAPVIVTQPVGQSRGPAAGRPDALLAVEATNATDYQWYKDGVEIPGATEATLSIPGVTLEDEGLYYCVASNAIDAVVSDEVWLEYARLTSHWTFDDTYGDAVGGYDIIPAAEPNAPTFAEGKIGNALALDGISQFARIPAEALPKNQHALTIAFWARNDIGTASATTAFYANTIEEPGNRLISAQIPFTNGNAQFDLGNADSGGGYDRASASMRPADDWVFWVISKDVETGAMTVYQNGSELGRNANAQRLFYGVEEFFVGARNFDDGLGQFFGGAIDDLKIYNYALDPVEIAYQYHDVTGDPVCVNPDDPVLQQFDYDGNCIVDIGDLAVFASNWLSCQRVPDCFERP